MRRHVNNYYPAVRVKKFFDVYAQTNAFDQSLLGPLDAIERRRADHPSWLLVRHSQDDFLPPSLAIAAAYCTNLSK